MGQFADLRKNTFKKLNIQIDGTIKKQSRDQMIEELFVHQLELETQHIDLIETQAELEESQRKYIELYNLAPLGYFTINANGLITEVNDAGAELLGIEKRMLINKAFSRYITTESQYIYSAYRQQISQKKVSEPCEIKLLSRLSSITVLLKIKVIKDDVLLMMLTDITQSKIIEKNSHQQQAKIANLNNMNVSGELISAITNELNEPLGVIANYVHGSIYRLKDNKYDAKKFLEVMEKTSRELLRINETILRIKNFIFKDNIKTRKECINEVIGEVISLINYELADFPISIIYKPNKHIPKIKLDKLHIQQVILNLARNGIEAMTDSLSSNAKLMIAVSQLNKTHIEICIVDNGPGFSPENAHKLFDTHFTTKHYGMGLGLAISRSIVEWHGGKLSASVCPIEGTCFKMTLPID